MCGIVGKIGKTKVEKQEIVSMMSALKHRGPDGEGVWVKDNYGIAHRRLSIIDLEKGAQPMWNKDKTIGITFNGEIYNYKQLRKELELKGCNFSTDSDTEVIIQAYIVWGGGMRRAETSRNVCFCNSGS